MIVTTLSQNGRLYLGCGDVKGELPKLIGDVNKYTNCFAKFFTKLFCRSAEIEIAGEKHCLNKNSFKKVLNRLGIACKTNKIASFNFDAYMSQQGDSFRKTYLLAPTLLSSLLSDQRRNDLSDRMLLALNHDRSDEVKSLVLSGAHPNNQFFYYYNQNLKYGVMANSRNEIMYRVNPQQPNAPEVYTSFYPFSFAIEKDERNLARFFYNVLNRDTNQACKKIYLYTQADVTKNALGQDMLMQYSVYTKEIFIKDATPGKEVFEFEK